MTLDLSVDQMRAMADLVVSRSIDHLARLSDQPSCGDLTEADALDWLRAWMDFPETTRGLFTTGGSMATFNAIVCARERILGPALRRGVLYASDQAHYSVMKAAKLAGILPDRVRSIESDDR